MNIITKFDENNFVKLFTGKCSGEIKDPAHIFPFPLDEFQKEANYRISIGENVLLCAHTGSGKTVPAIYAIAEAIRNNKKVIYTSPIKTLSNQKYEELSGLFDSVGIMTGDIKKNPDAQCVVMTTEILRNILYRNSKSEDNDGVDDMTNNKYQDIDPSEIGYVIFDEVHYFRDPHRGKVWEETIVLLDRNVVMVMLSATIDKPEDFAGWIGQIKQKNVSLIPTKHRVVPLKHYFWKDKELIEIVDEKNNFINYNQIAEKYYSKSSESLLGHIAEFLMESDLTPALFFKFSRIKCEEYARNIRKNLLTHEERNLIEREFNKIMSKYRTQYEHLNQYIELKKLLMKGVAFHHSGLIPILKETVEILYGMGLIKILFATETFAVGVNKPVRTVIFSELQKYDNDGMRSLRSDEYTQMAGRAGRRGIDKIGTVILIPTFELPTHSCLKGILVGKGLELKSQFMPTYQFVLKSIQKNGMNISKFVGQTMFDLEQRKEISQYQLKLNDMYKEKDKIKIDDSILELYEEYCSINERISNRMIKIKKKEIKNLKKRLTDIEYDNQFSNNKLLCDSMIKINKNIYNTESQIKYLDSFIMNDIHKAIDLLKKNLFIDDENNLTTRGVLATKINECHELILADLVIDDFFEGMTLVEIVTVLSVFINEGGRSDGVYLTDLELPYKMEKYINNIRSMMTRYSTDESELGLYLGYQDNLYLNFVLPANVWVNGGNIGDIYNYTDMYEGNFVKGIMRLNNICEDLKEMLEIAGKIEVVKVLENSEELLVRDIVTVNSLYVQ